jgi:pyruvate formate lyase activating enzyme
MQSGLIFDIRKFSIRDGPGIRTTVFFKGCPLSCWWCHNPESQSPHPELIEHQARCLRCGECIGACPNHAIEMIAETPITDRELCQLCGECLDYCTSEAREIAGERMTVAEVIRVIERDLPFYESSHGGVTFSGGEPLNQSTFLEELLVACKALDLHTALDTCGYAPWKVLDKIRPHVDLFLYDLKLIDDDLHKQYTGVSNKLILENLEKLAHAGHHIKLRVPLIPGITDTPENLAQIGDLTTKLPGIEHLDLLPYHAIARGKYDRLHQEYKLPELETPADTHTQRQASILESFGLKVTIGG